jgi:tetratricopeptide (TPR) repeat protein
MRKADRRSDLRLNLENALAHHQAGRIKLAKRRYEEVLSKQPDQPDALHLLGVIALEEQKIETAIELISKAVLALPTEESVRNNLGNAYKAAGRLAEAQISYKKAIALAPRFVAARLNLGNLQIDMGEFRPAVESFESAIELDPNLADAYIGVATAHRALEEFGLAEAALRRAISLQPNLNRAMSHLATLLGEQDRFIESVTLHEKAIELAPSLGSQIIEYARTLYRAGDFLGAVKLYRRAIELEEGIAFVWNELGRTLRVLGKLNEARACFERAHALDPEFVDAHRNLALLADDQNHNDRKSQLISLLNKPSLTEQDKAIAGFALGKIFDDEERYDEAFGAYSSANKRIEQLNQAAGRQFDCDALRRDVDRLIGTQIPSYSRAETLSDLPVFIVGMPRSGTSLVEQIAASHSHVYGAGELRDIRRISQALGGGDVRAATGLAQDHIARLTELGRGAIRVIDKMPDNVFFLDTIASVFPQARVIFCTRNSMDLCLSCYFQLFSSGNAFSYNLTDCGRRDVQVRRLIEHWQRSLPLASLTVQYENMVEGLETECKRIIDFLDLSWEPSCLEFYRTDRAVATASGWQVRQPIYSRSIGRWKHYENHLTKLKSVLLEEIE